MTGRNNAETVAWICLAVGLVVLLTGLIIGFMTSLWKPPRDPGSKIKEAKEKIEETQAQIQMASAAGGLEAASNNTAAASAEAAKSALEQVEGIVGSLPENLRFSGMLVLVGAVLISVATIQFGGISLF